MTFRSGIGIDRAGIVQRRTQSAGVGNASRRPIPIPSQRHRSEQQRDAVGGQYRRDPALWRGGYQLASRADLWSSVVPATPSRSTAPSSPSWRRAPPATSSTSPTISRRCSARSTRSRERQSRRRFTAGSITLHSGVNADLSVTSSNTAAFAALGFTGTVTAHARRRRRRRHRPGDRQRQLDVPRQSQWRAVRSRPTTCRARR